MLEKPAAAAGRLKKLTAFAFKCLQRPRLAAFEIMAQRANDGPGTGSGTWVHVMGDFKKARALTESAL